MNDFFLSDNYNCLSHKRVSVMAVVRSSVDNIIKRISNVFQTCLNPDNVEMLIRMDDDDLDFILLSKSEIFNKYNVKLYVGLRHGYMGMNKYYNELVSMTVGDIIFHWGDGGIILTNGWDNILFSHAGEVAVLQNMVHYDEGGHLTAVIINNFSPVITRPLYDILQTYSPCILSDSYYDNLGEISGIKKMSGISILIDNASMNERGWDAWGEFKNMTDKVQSDADKVVKYLDSNNLERRKIPYFVVENSPVPKLEIRGGPRYCKYLVEFINVEEGKVILSKSFPRYNWASLVNAAAVRVTDESGVVIFEYSFDLHE